MKVGHGFTRKEEYIDLVIDCIERLPKEMVIHRLTGDGPRDTLIGPKWSLNKWEVLNSIDRRFIERDNMARQNNWIQ